MSKFTTDVIYDVTKEAKGNDLELGNLYFINVPVVYAKVHTPAKKYGVEDTAYQLVLFIDQPSMDKLDEIGINKEFAQVGVTKIKKGSNRGKFKFELNDTYKDYEGMFGAQLGRDTIKRNKNGEVVKEYTPLKVITPDGKAFKDDVGNGSVCTVKCFAYRNSDDMLVVMMDTVVVVDHVPYEKSGSDGYDPILGIKIQVADKPTNPVEDDPILSGAAKKAPVKAAEPEPDFDDIPF